MLAKSRTASEKGRTKKIDVQELKEDTKREGMSGISTRFIMKALDKHGLRDNTIFTTPKARPLGVPVAARTAEGSATA